MISELKNILKKEGHCRQSRKDLDNVNSFGYLMQMMFDYKIELAKKHFPAIDFVEKHFNHIRDVARSYGFFYNEKSIIKNVGRVVLTGSSNCDIVVDNYTISEVILRHSSHAKIHLSKHGMLRIYVCDDSTYEVIEQEDRTSLKVRQL